MTIMKALTTALLQAYYRYYFADGNQQKDNGKAYVTHIVLTKVARLKTTSLVWM